jgi:hypothetical protein
VLVLPDAIDVRFEDKFGVPYTIQRIDGSTIFFKEVRCVCHISHIVMSSPLVGELC